MSESLLHVATACKDKFAVIVGNENSVVGHLLYNIASAVLHFLKGNVNSGIESEANQLRDRLYGLEWPKGILKEAQGMY